MAPLSAQARGTIRGSVVDRVTQRPLTGARVIVLGSDLQGSADNAGRYVIRDVPAGTQTVRVTFIGYGRMDRQVIVNIGQEAIVDFGMQPAAVEMDQVIVTGTGGRRERRVIGNSVSSLRVEEITADAPVVDLEELLTARVPGVTLLSNSGQVGTTSTIRIRGSGSMNTRNTPLFFIDGVLVESNTVGGGSTIQAGSPLDFINPEDIESIEVIKGPGASTLYGATAANGVIQIITKKGSRGQEGVRWTSSFEYGQVDWPKFVDPPLNYWRCTEAQQTSNTYPGCQVVAGNRAAEDVQWWGKDANGDAVLYSGIADSDVIQIPGTNDFVLKDNPLRRHPAAIREGKLLDFNLSATGGGRSFSYFLSLNRNEEDGVFFNNYSRRTAGRANFDFNVAEMFDMVVNLTYARTALQQPLNNNASNSVLRNTFRGRARATNDPWEPGFRGFNPWLSNEFDQQRKIERFTVGVTANWDPFSWFQNRLTLGMDRQSYRQTTFYEIDTTGRAPWGTINATGTIDHFLPITHVWTMDYGASLEVDITPHLTSRTSGGTQLIARQRRTTSSRGEGLVANNLNLVGSAAVTTGDEGFSEQTALGFYVQEELGWKNRLFLTGALRADDNSSFGTEMELVLYPKAQFSWIISDEEFFPFRWVDQLKLRAAWGQAGSAPAPSEADRTYTTGNTTIDNAVQNLLLTSRYGNPNLKSETGSEWESGFDASMAGGRAGLEFTYYNQRTKDALISVPDPGSTGYTGTHLVNVGEISNTGFEVLISGSPVYSRTLSWDASVSLSTNSNKLVSFNGVRDEIRFGAFASVQRHREGYPMAGYWGVDVERDASGEPVLDADGDATLLSTCRWAPSDETWTPAECPDEIYIGPSLPTREIGLTNTFTVLGNLRIFAHFDYKGGFYQWCAICSVNSRIDLNTWDIATGGTELNPDVSAAEVEALRTRQTLSHITQADFIKFRELSLTYSIPQSWGSIFASSRWSFTLAGRNLWMWTKYEGYGDPEVQFFSTGSFSRLDYASTPMTRRVSASMRVSF
jgi:TonB-linked SusC/RagA family outer membrane protein